MTEQPGKVFDFLRNCTVGAKPREHEGAEFQQFLSISTLPCGKINWDSVDPLFRDGDSHSFRVRAFKQKQPICIVCACVRARMRHTLRIWSPSSSPSLAAGLSSRTPATKIPTSFPPANRRPTLSPFLNLTSFMLGLGRKTEEEQ